MASSTATKLLSAFYNRRQHRVRAGWRLLIHLVATTFILIAGYIAIGVGSYFANISPDGHVFVFLSGFVQSAVLVATVLLASWLVDRRRISGLGIDRNWGVELIAGFALGAVAMLAIFAIEHAMGWIEIRRLGPSDEVSVSTLVASQLMWLTMMILVGVSEEMLSRGYHMKNLSEGLRPLGVWPSVLIAGLLSSLFFGLLHAMNPNSSWISNLGVALAGIMLATGRVATGSLAAPIGLHISWNLFQGPVLGFPVSGNTTDNSVVEIIQGGDPVWTGGEFGPEAGLIGVMTTLLLLLVFLAWGRGKHRTTRYVAALSHFQDRRPSVMTKSRVMANGRSSAETASAISIVETEPTAPSDDHPILE